jgi:hypothetical protein
VARAKFDLSFSTGSAQWAIQEVSQQKERGPRNVYEVRGASEADVEARRLTGNCRCSGLKTKCHVKVPMRALQTTCRVYWGLNEEERGHVLRMTYRQAQGGFEGEMSGEENELESRSCVQWHLAGVPVCFSNFCHLLGTSEPTVRKQLRGEMDGRRLREKSAPSVQAEHVDFFFYEIYHSAAEPLPLSHRGGNPRGKKGPTDHSLVAVWFDDEAWLHLGDAWEEEALPPVGSMDQPSVDSLAGFTLVSKAGLPSLAQRYLPHCELHDLYWLFSAAWEVQTSRRPELQGISCPSYSTFRRRWGRWKGILTIRPATNFAQCQTCFELTKGMNSRQLDWQKRTQAARDLKAHYSHQYLDRCIYWSCRFASQTDQNVLCIIIDSMDRAKLAWPRFMHDRAPKWLEKIIRPKLVLTGAMAHGWCTCLYTHHESLPHGANLFCEVLCQTVERVYQISRTSGRRFPQHLVVQSDNTVAQAKNECAFLLLAFFVAKYKFLTANIFFLLVGHTHEDIDQLFALVLKIVLRPHRFDTPAEFLGLLRESMEDNAARKGELVFADMLPTVRNFEAWLSPMNVELKNCFQTRDGKETPHAFSFKLRRDLHSWDVGVAGEPEGLETSRGRYEPRALGMDVMCSVKMYMRDVGLQQPPIRILTPCRADRVQGSSPDTIVQRKPLSKDEITHYLQLESACREALECPAAAAALFDLVHRREYPMPASRWMDVAEAPAPPAPETTHPFFPHLPASSWKLQVHYGRLT